MRRTQYDRLYQQQLGFVFIFYMSLICIYNVSCQVSELSNLRLSLLPRRAFLRHQVLVTISSYNQDVTAWISQPQDPDRGGCDW